jgi:hypothetical protein
LGAYSSQGRDELRRAVVVDRCAHSLAHSLFAPANQATI